MGRVCDNVIGNRSLLWMLKLAEPKNVFRPSFSMKIEIEQRDACHIPLVGRSSVENNLSRTSFRRCFQSIGTEKGGLRNSRPIVFYSQLDMVLLKREYMRRHLLTGLLHGADHAS